MSSQGVVIGMGLFIAFLIAGFAVANSRKKQPEPIYELGRTVVPFNATTTTTNTANNAAYTVNIPNKKKPCGCGAK